LPKTFADIPEIRCSLLTFSPADFGVPGPAVPDFQRAAHDEITAQLFDYLEKALQNKDDPWQAIKVIANGERILAIYVNAACDRLEPLRADLARTLHVAARMARRFFIKKAFSCSNEDYPKYNKWLREFGWSLGDPLVAEDYKAVRAHLDFGKALFADIHRRTRRSMA
jgi:hypothetical protein